MQTEDCQIIRQCLNGDTAMFGFLVDKYKKAVYALAYSRLGNFHDAQDIAQEAFIKAYRKLHSLRHWDNFALWLSAITNNLCKDFIRSKSKRPDREFADDQSQEIIDHTSVDSYRESLADESLKEALNSLPEIYRQVLVLHYLSGYNSMDIAHLLGISIRTVAERLRVGRERLKEEVVGMMSVTLKEQSLPAGFTFKIVEMVKRIRIHPIAQGKGLPWGISLATGVIITAFCLNPYMTYFSQMDTFAGSPLPGETKVLKTGEIPVDILKTSEITVISSKVEKGKGGEAKKPENALLLAPQDEGGMWTKKADMPTAKCGLCASMINGKIYAIGGGKYDANMNAVILSEVEEYDPATDRWTKKADMPTARLTFSTAVVNGKIYAIGGAQVSFGSLSIVEEYDPAADKWTKKADMPTARACLSASAVNGKIYAIGGWRGNTHISAVEEYDPATDTWTKKADMPTARGFLSTSELNGKIYAIGGMFFKGSAYSTVEEYNPATDTWARKADMPTSRLGLATSVVDGKIYAIGGVQDTLQFSGLSIVEEYDPERDIWTKKADMPTARFWLASGVVDGEIYTFGGSKEWVGVSVPGAPFSTVEKFAPEDKDWSAIFPQGKQPKTWGNIKSR